MWQCILQRHTNQPACLAQLVYNSELNPQRNTALSLSQGKAQKILLEGPSRMQIGRFYCTAQAGTMNSLALHNCVPREECFPVDINGYRP